jgi:hypothetical protein
VSEDLSIFILLLMKRKFFLSRIVDSMLWLTQLPSALASSDRGSAAFEGNGSSRRREQRDSSRRDEWGVGTLITHPALFLILLQFTGTSILPSLSTTGRATPALYSKT